MRPDVSIVITTYNEREELRRTIESVTANTYCSFEVIVVDDGSTDGSSEGIECDHVKVLRSEHRIGIAHSRLKGSAAANGQVICYLDAHQRVSPGCLDSCAEHSVQHSCIVSPDIKDFGRVGWRLHGATFELCPERGYFSARWRRWFQLRRVARISGLRAPAYLIPSNAFDKVAWSAHLRGWGGSEACVCLKAFFAGVPIHHLRGPISWHKFQATSNFPVTWGEVYRNHAVIARVCFEESTWQQHWRPFFERHLESVTLAELDAPSLIAERETFSRIKVRPDKDFWKHLLRQRSPAGI